MSTENIKLGKIPVQITDGTILATIQSKSNYDFHWAESATIPDKTAGHFTDQLDVGYGAKVWIWFNTITDKTIDVTVTKIIG